MGRSDKQQVYVHTCPLAVNAALTAFAAECRATAPRYHSQLPATGFVKAAPLLLQWDDSWTDRQNTIALHKTCFAYYAGSAYKLSKQTVLQHQVTETAVVNLEEN